MVSRIEGEKVVGLKQTMKYIQNNKGKCLYVAKNADGKLTDPVVTLAKKRLLKIIYVDTMKNLGMFCGIEVGAAVALLI
ncbi:50S ribosomal protein L7ae [Clostridium botulinum C]|uniref:50S ribosomal protein L7ae n=4 Tax=Clostridium TaxID=1485 RepID=A0A9Q4TMF0_CLOBO|nr:MULTISPECIES: ribosomal L7Ae/L30e/S12e/Gadd45 family protein [Clostridium]AYF53765.1 50S ribosomal protein L7ae [Clostridium novyi]EES90710.1 ribosomal protein L7Ae family protein [Clostridium botulinum D str. 1873]KEI08818.1 50S ribosomal protein L7 [Clostridium sp. K25]KEI10761.1 50S ribosomal protein L7 [Clostridium novyi B str. NCTC 9691]KEI17170.1 50S ribosomal protein L7 [Clostridium haemolyticum NCTC 9693]